MDDVGPSRRPPEPRGICQGTAEVGPREATAAEHLIAIEVEERQPMLRGELATEQRLHERRDPAAVRWPLTDQQHAAHRTVRSSEASTSSTLRARQRASMVSAGSRAT